ncbi:MAG: host-nuclease inhibitor Gam family protein [Leptospiraceae bacterium]|nr:host-nuclease inhibitor Gam family protein [Leptospiraceae bacterium]
MAKTRTRVATPQQIKNLDEANAALAEIGVLTAKTDAIDAVATRKIGAIKEKAATDGAPHRERIKELESALSLYAEYNKSDLFKEKKTLTLAYGNIGYRFSTKVSIKTKTTLELLKKLFPGRAVRIKEEVDKEELKEWDDSELATVDAAKVEQDTFFYEVNQEQVNADLLKRVG